MQTRRERLFLLDHDESQIIGAKLPSNGQVLRVLFYNLRKVKLDIRSSAHLVIKEVEVMWEKARIPTKKVQHSVSKLESLYNEWRAIQKNSTRRNQPQKTREQDFLDKLDDLFDIAHADALELMNIEEDKLFLQNQRQKGRPGSMIGGDRVLYTKEKKQAIRKQQEESRRIQHEMSNTEDETVELELQLSSSSTEDERQFSDNEEKEFQDPVDLPGPSNQKRRRAQKRFITSKLVATLDRCKVSDRYSVRVIAAVAQALGHNVEDLVISRTSIRRHRTKLRVELAQKLREVFNNCELDALTIHWDGKLLPSLKGAGKVERLAVLITCRGTEKLLGIPMISSSSGNAQASAVHELLEEWGLSNKVQALCCDTTASNTGRYQGACVLLEQKLERELLYLPCRHHIYEIILHVIFSEKMLKSSGPNVPLFKKFQDAWSTIDTLDFIPGIETAYVRQTIQVNVIQEVIQFSIDILQNERQPRKDYEEFLELIIIFLGGTPPKNIRFKTPGAFHHARWMAKAIYCLKIYLFKHQFRLSTEEEIGIRDICVFLAIIYVKAWIRAPMAVEAPRHDLEFLQQIYAYRCIDEKISCIAVKKFCNHLWYLSTESAALSFFDKLVEKGTKQRMVEALNNESDESSKKCVITPHDVEMYVHRGIEYFISQGSKRFFERFSISMEFLKKDSDLWEDDDDFKYGLNIVQQLKVVNDTAERGVKLIEDYSQLLTKNETEKQYILQIVSENRKQFPDVSKRSLLKDM